KDGFPGNRGLARCYQGRRALGQINIEPRPKPDHAKALTGSNGLAGAHETDDAARNKACDLYHRNSGVGSCNHQAIAFVVDARFVEIGIEELAGMVDDLLDFSGGRTAIDVAVEDR